MPIALYSAAFNLAVALLCGAVIGSERQVRQRMAGLRTNALVSLGAAGFVIFSAQFPNEISQTRVAAQVVSGIGFLGAGIIFRDGFNVHGLNTAATLWCSAAVGLLAGAGVWPLALLLTGFVVFINLGLRPLVKWLKRHTPAGMPMTRSFRVEVRCAREDEAGMRGLILRSFTVGGLHLTEIESRVTAEGEVDLTATITGEGVTDMMLEQSVQRMAVEPGVRHLRWQIIDDT